MTVDLSTINLHACMGATCYCRPGNTAHVWTDAEKEELMNAFREMAELEQGSTNCITRDVADGF